MRLFVTGWQVAYRKRGCGCILTDMETPFVLLPNTWRYQAADPFLFIYEGVTYIFAELLDHLTCRGILGYSKLQNGRWSSWKPVIREKWHLSWPYIFERDGEILIMPEAGASESLYFYRATHFPDKWKRQTPFATGHTFADPIDITIDGKTYFWVYMMDTHPKSLWMAEMKDGKPDYSAYLSPVSTDDGSARPAGRFFYRNGELIRVAQDCEGDYGRGIVFTQVNMTQLEYGLHEREILRIYADDIKIDSRRKIYGMHTYNSNERYEVIDVKPMCYSLVSMFGRLLAKLRRIFQRKYAVKARCI